MEVLDVKPIIEFENDGSVLVFEERIAKIVVGIYQKEIGHRTVSVLNSAVDIKIICLSVELQKVCPEELIGKCKLDFWSN